MKRKKRSARALLFVLAFLVSLVMPSGMASATSVYDQVIEPVSNVHLSRDGSTQGFPLCTQLDITNEWASILVSPSAWTSRTQVIGGATRNAMLADWATAQGNATGWAVVQQHNNNASTPNDGSPIGDAVYVIFTPSASAQISFSSDPIYFGAQKQAYLSTADNSYVYSIRIQFDDLGAPGGTDQCTPVISMALRDSVGNQWFKELLSVATTSTESVGGYSLRPLFVKAAINYPPGYEGAVIPTEAPAARYVGMGDSYSSGQGSRRPYMAGTETATNKCRRSSVAYPLLLGADTSLNLGPTSFVACGGAQASAITTDGFNGESAQMNALTSETDLVTMTIIGNDIPFDEFARACATPGFDQGCHLTGQAYLDAMTSIDVNVKPRLEQLLQTLDDRLTVLGSDARVLVIGYPHLLPQAWVYETGCWWLQPDELPAIRAVQDALNAAIYDKVAAKGGRFEFVSATASGSPFTGHELCREASASSNYFNGVVSGENEADSFHPNEAGQDAYARLIKNYLALHPLG